MAGTNYVSQAKQYLKGSFDTAKANLQNNFNQNMNQMDSDTKTTNTNYNNAEETAKQTGENNKASYNNGILNRGMTRSTIAQTGITGIDNQTAGNVSKINLQRQSELDNITRLKEMLRSNLTNSINSAQSDYNSKIQDMAMQLKQRDEDVSYRNRQLADEEANSRASRANQAAQLALEREKFKYQKDSAANSTEFDETAASQSAIADMKKYIKNGDVDSMNKVRDLIYTLPISTDTRTYISDMYDEGMKKISSNKSSSSNTASNPNKITEYLNKLKQMPWA